MLIVLISYPFLVGPAIGVFWLIVRNFAGGIFFDITLPIFFSAIFPLLLYFFSCLLVSIFFSRRKEVAITKVAYWESGMFVGMLVAILLVILGTSPFISSTRYLNLNYFITFTSLIFYPLSFLSLNIFNSFNEIIKTISCWSDVPSCGAEGGLWFIFEYYGIIMPIVSGIVIGGLIGFIFDLFKRKKISGQAESKISLEEKETIVRWPLFSYWIVLGIVILAMGTTIWWGWPSEVQMSSKPINLTQQVYYDDVGEKKIGGVPISGCHYPGPIFSPDGYHFACGVWYDQKFWENQQNKLSRKPPASLLVLDGQIIATYGTYGTEQYEHIAEESLIFSPDSKHFVYKASKNSQAFLVIDGKEEEKYDWITSYPIIAFSQNGEHYAYAAHRDNKEYIIFDGREIAEYNDIYEGPVLSTDGQHLAYAYGVGRPPSPNIIVDNQEKGSFNFLRYLTFSPDGAYFAFMTSTEKGKYYIKVNGEDGKEYDAIAKPIFSPDNQHLAYAAKEGNKILIILDGEIKKEFESAELLTGESGLERTDYLTFSPDSQHLAYVIQTVSKIGNDYKRKQFVFLDDENKYEYEISPYKEIDFLVFSPDSKHLLFRVARKTIVVDGKNFGERYDNVYNPHFSPDGNYVVYNARKDKVFYRVMERIQ